MWQDLYEELKDRNFTIVTVAMDSRAEAARPFIEAAAPTHLSLIDRTHYVAELYNMVNVPQAVWIDEAGRIVRPPEAAGAYEAFRARDPDSGAIPDATLATKEAARATYIEAIRDWVALGAESRHVFDAAEAKAHLSLPDENVALAQAHFRLGQFLLGRDRPAAAEPLLAEARRLHPESWTIWRQTEVPDENGIAAGPEFWARIEALGEKRFYPVVDMEGMPTDLPG